jgi:SAM-dependent methyltransferase
MRVHGAAALVKPVTAAALCADLAGAALDRPLPPEYLLPHAMSIGDLLFDALMYPLEAMALRRRRRTIIPRARGAVLEVGAGTGANLRYYRWERVSGLDLVDIAPGGALMRTRAISGVPVRTREADAQSLPFPDRSFDTVVSTLVFCSVPDQARGLSEVRRVLRDGGIFVFMEHVRPDGRRSGRLMDVLNPFWLSLNGQCNLNRDTLAAIRNAGFCVRGLRRSGGGILIDGVARRAERHGAPSS